MSNNSNESGFVAGLVIGGLVGFLAGVMIAPKAGEETRAQVWDNTREARDRIEDMLDEVRDEASRAVDKIRQRVATTSVSDSEPVPEEEEEKI